MTDRSRYTPALRAFLAQLDERGLTAALRTGRASEDQVFDLAGLGLVSSSVHRVGKGENFWRLRFTRTGQALRKLLAAEAARA